MRRNWTTEEDDYLINHYGKLSYKAIGEKLGRTENAAQNRAKTLGITEDKPQRATNRMSDYKKRVVRDNVEKMSVQEIAKKIKLSVFEVEEELERIGKIQKRKNTFDEKDKDYINFMRQVEKVKKILTEKGSFGGYTLVSALKDKAVLLNKKKHRVCLTYTELVIKLRGEEVDDYDEE